MVRLTDPVFGMLRTFAKIGKRPNYNHRKPLRYQRFQANIDPEEIVAKHSQDDFGQIDRRAGERTFLDAQLSMGRKDYLLPNLTDQDLETNQLYQNELDRQRAIIARVDKIQVFIDSVPGIGSELIMNRDISTPYDCARHIHELLTTRSVVAEITPIDNKSTNTNQIESKENNLATENQSLQQAPDVVKQVTRSLYWDMHRPLTESCRLKFRHFEEKNVSEVNKIYWRSCSFVLGMAIRLAFKDEIKVLLHSWPRPNIKSGSFVYDVALNLSERWTPSEQELRAFTKVMWDIKGAALPFERIQVDRDVARQFFRYNPFKLSQLDSILENKSSRGKITVYRCGGLLDISIGPMISNTSQIGRITLASVHPYDTEEQNYKDIFYRFQGVSLPQQLPVSSFLYQNILINQAKKPNSASI